MCRALVRGVSLEHQGHQVELRFVEVVLDVDKVEFDIRFNQVDAVRAVVNLEAGCAERDSAGGSPGPDLIGELWLRVAVPADSPARNPSPAAGELTLKCASARTITLGVAASRRDEPLVLFE